MRILFLCLALLLASCSNQSKNSTCTISANADPGVLDPRKARTLVAVNISKALFEGLARLDENGDIALSLAEKISPFENGIMIDLREAKWSDGANITAYDFEYAWKKVLSPDFPSPHAFLLYFVKNAEKIKKGEMALEELGVQVVNEKTLMVDFEYTPSDLLSLFAQPALFPVPCGIDEKNPNAFFKPETMISSGPYLLQAWIPSSKIHLEKNPNYWDAANVVQKKIELSIVADQTAIAIYERGTIDWVGSPLSTLPTDTVSIMKKQIGHAPMLSTYFFRCNTNKPHLSNPLFRKILAMSIDQEAIINAGYQGFYQKATSFVPDMPNWKSSSSLPGYDPEKAKILLTALVSNPGEIDLEIATTISENQKLIGQIVQDQLQRNLGIKVHLRSLEHKSLLQKIKSHEYDLALGDWSADLEDPMNFLEIFESKEKYSNNTGWENQEYRHLLGMAKLSSLDKRFELFQSAEKILLTELPILPLFHPEMLYLKSERLQGVVLSPLGGIDLKWVKITK